MASDIPPQFAESALALVHEGWRQLHLQRPLASWAFWQQAMRLNPDDQAASAALDRLETSEELPEVARKPRRLANPTDVETRERWDEVFRSRNLADLADAAEAFEELAEQEPTDAAAWSNRALCLAWLGRNEEAIDALDYLVHLTAATDPDGAAEAWALAEVLRHGAGAEHRADDLSFTFEVPWPEGTPPPFEADEAAGLVRAMPMPVDPLSREPLVADSRIIEWLDRPMPPSDPEPTLADLPIVRAVVILKGNLLRCSGFQQDQIEELERTIEGRLGRGVEFDRSITPLPMALLDSAVASVRLPEGLTLGTRDRLQKEAIASYFENHWVNIPRLGLGAGLGDESGPLRRSPLEASRLASEGDEVMRAKLSGVILVREQLARRPRSVPLYLGYDFDQLRRRLGLDALDSPPPGVDLPLQPRDDPS